MARLQRARVRPMPVACLGCIGNLGEPRGLRHRIHSAGGDEPCFRSDALRVSRRARAGCAAPSFVSEDSRQGFRRRIRHNPYLHELLHGGLFHSAVPNAFIDVYREHRRIAGSGFRLHLGDRSPLCIDRAMPAPWSRHLRRSLRSDNRAGRQHGDQLRKPSSHTAVSLLHMSGSLDDRADDDASP